MGVTAMSEMALDLKLRKITASEYYRMADHRILREDERVELIDGFLVEMPPIGNRHGAVQAKVLEYLFRTLAGRVSILGPLSVPLGEHNVPLTDIGIFTLDEKGYFGRPPRVDEALAIVEVADASLNKDIGPKRDLYARCGVTEYLISDIENRLLRRYTNPDADRYRGLEHLRYGDTFSLKTIPDITLDVDGFLPPRG